MSLEDALRIARICEEVLRLSNAELYQASVELSNRGLLSEKDIVLTQMRYRKFPF